MKCEKCGANTDSLEFNVFDCYGSDYWMAIPITESHDAAIVQLGKNWTGYELDESEKADTIRCPHCGKFPFRNKEVQDQDFVAVVMFKSN